MGGNCSYNKTLDRIPGRKRTHQEYHDRIGGHKILLQNKNQGQSKVPMNSNSESPLYLIGKRRKDGSVEVVSIGIYEKHKCVGQIDLEFDKNGNLIPYTDNSKGTSHYHNFNIDTESGKSGRKRHDKSNIHPIGAKYDELIQQIVDYNKSHKK